LMVNNMAATTRLVSLIALAIISAHAFIPSHNLIKHNVHPVVAHRLPHETARFSTTADVETENVEKGETYEFQAEVSRVMDIIINSLYSNRDVFLRELVSNAADACDKKRFLSITDGNAAAEEGFKIQIKADADNKKLIIEDSGVGMTKDELVNNLGRIAQSGTAKFVEALGKGEADVNLIGQFGVGFYSGFLVSDKMSVVTKAFQGDGKQYRWTSGSGDKFTVAEDDSEPIVGSGTRVILDIKDDAQEYLDEVKLRSLLKKYSEFVSFPINLWAEKTSYKQVEDEEAEPPAEGEKPKMKTVSETTSDWERLNKLKPVWLRKPADVKEEEYTEFYKSTFRAYEEPLAHTHFSLEGQVEFRSVLFIPGVLPFELSRNMFDDESRAMKLYVKRVFINDKFEELVPRYLMFLRGVVDSEDLPLNVGREILQKSKMLSVINKRVVKKAIDMMIKLKEDEEKFNKFSDSFGKYIKVGIIEDDDNRQDLAQLCRFMSSASGNKFITLDQYVDNMKTNQTSIYFVTGDSKEQAAMSPALEKCQELGYEVIYSIEPIDELALQAISKYADKYDVVDVAKEHVMIGEESEENKKKYEDKQEELEPVLDYLKDLFKDKVSKVSVSTKLTKSPALLTQGAYGMSPQMQRYMRAQAVSIGEDAANYGGNMAQTVLELNPFHEIVQQLKDKVATAPEDEGTKQTAYLMYDIAALTGGYTLDDPARFAARVTDLMVGVGQPDAPVDGITDQPDAPVDAEIV